MNPGLDSVIIVPVPLNDHDSGNVSPWILWTVISVCILVFLCVVGMLLTDFIDMKKFRKRRRK